MQKNVIRDVFIIIIVVIGVIFSITTIFGGLKGKDDSIFSAIGEKVGTIKQEPHISEIATELEEISEAEMPTIYYVGGSRTVGDAVSIEDMFEVQYENTSRMPLSEAENTFIFFVDVRDTSGNILVEKLTTEDIEKLEEIPSAFIYDKDQHILHFHQSGTFIVSIRVYSGTSSGMLYEFEIPVEVG